ncbi:hypothetical protein DFH09DRAFT_1087395 [Mycena vulgaris]|nr:hypothetical protein DFH09DRAFT_1087395 [Mycena vulgaris]
MKKKVGARNIHTGKWSLKRRWCVVVITVVVAGVAVTVEVAAELFFHQELERRRFVVAAGVEFSVVILLDSIKGKDGGGAIENLFRFTFPAPEMISDLAPMKPGQGGRQGCIEDDFLSGNPWAHLYGL